jgi:uncharacterized membrane protein
MLGWYGVLKVLHVLSVVVWIGGVLALTTVTSFLIRARDRATLAAWFPYSARYGQRIAGPASILVLFTGIAIVFVGGIGFRPLWVSWGFAGILLHFVYGATVMRKRGIAFVSLLSESPASDTRIAEAGGRMLTGNLIYLLLMTSVIVVMVFKPTL